MDEKQYPELPTHFMLVQAAFRDEVYLYTADQMRAYVDADRAMRAVQAAPAAWRHSRTYSVYEAAEQVPIADGDEWAEPLYLHPPAAPASQDAEDAPRYRYLQSIAVQTADPLGPIFRIDIRRIDQDGVWSNVSATIDAHIAAARAAKEGETNAIRDDEV